MSDCLFCKIISGEIPSDMVFENPDCYAFRDINPQAPVHVLVVPRMHIESINSEFAAIYAEKVLAVVPTIAILAGIRNGYRLITNYGPDAHQSVNHLHFHILGGGDLGEKLV